MSSSSTHTLLALLLLAVASLSMTAVHSSDYMFDADLLLDDNQEKYATLDGPAGIFSAVSGLAFGGVDVNQDGKADLFVYQPLRGVIDVHYGSSSFTDDSINLDTEANPLDGTNGFTITGIDISVALIGSTPKSVFYDIGDLNGDALDDILLYTDQAAAITVFFTQETDYGAEVDISTMFANNQAVVISAPDTYDGYLNLTHVPSDWGKNKIQIGDLNGDGASDLVLYSSSYRVESPLSWYGGMVILFGGVHWDAMAAEVGASELIEEGHGMFLYNAGTDGAFTDSAFFLGDINGDGKDDLLVRKEEIALQNTDAGVDYIPGRGEWPVQDEYRRYTFDEVAQGSINSTDARLSGYFGDVSFRVGDFDADGYQDVGFSDGAVTGSGPYSVTLSIVVLFGGPHWTSVGSETPLGDFRRLTISFDATQQAPQSWSDQTRGRYNTDMNGDGVGEILASASGPISEGNNIGVGVLVISGSANYHSDVSGSSASIDFEDADYVWYHAPYSCPYSDTTDSMTIDELIGDINDPTFLDINGDGAQDIIVDSSGGATRLPKGYVIYGSSGLFGSFNIRSAEENSHQLAFWGYLGVLGRVSPSGSRTAFALDETTPDAGGYEAMTWNCTSASRNIRFNTTHINSTNPFMLIELINDYTAVDIAFKGVGDQVFSYMTSVENGNIEVNYMGGPDPIATVGASLTPFTIPALSTRTIVLEYVGSDSAANADIRFTWSTFTIVGDTEYISYGDDL